MAAGTVRVPPFVGQQRGLLSLPVPRVHDLQSGKQLSVDKGHSPAARPCLLRVGTHVLFPGLAVEHISTRISLSLFFKFFTYNNASVTVYVAVVQVFLELLYVSRATQFRWIQKEVTGERQSWGVDHVYIGEACPGLCSGHGYCTSGVVCICDEGHHGGPQTAY